LRASIAAAGTSIAPKQFIRRATRGASHSRVEEQGMAAILPASPEEYARHAEKAGRLRPFALAAAERALDYER
jgi:hypothetical protein